MEVKECDFVELTNGKTAGILFVGKTEETAGKFLIEELDNEDYEQYVVEAKDIARVIKAY